MRESKAKCLFKLLGSADVFNRTYHMSAVPLAAMKLHEDLLQALMR